MRRFRILGILVILAMMIGVLPHQVQPVMAASPSVFINEIHYDNTGTDTGEAIEVAGPAGTDLTGWSIVLYNGNGGASYNSDALSGLIPDIGGGFGVVVMNYPVNGIQNGAPDGIALVDAGNAVVQFLSYEGTFTAVGGPADGMVSVDIGVLEGGSDPIGQSLQLTGTGTTYTDFTWSAPATATFGAFNNGQEFGSAGPAEPKINEFSASTTGTDVEYVEIFGAPETDYSAYTVLEIEGDTTGAGVVDEVIGIGTTDAAGFYLVNLPANTLENGTLSLLLVKNFTGAYGADLDTDNDGIFDVTPWDAIVDSVAVNDGGTGDVTYGVPTLGVSYDGLPYAPGGASRYPDGKDTDAASDWVRNDFDLAGIPGYAGSIVLGEAYNTPGEPNQIYIPPPEACGDPYTPIYEVQGSGTASPLVGTEVAVEGVVVGDYQNNAMPDSGDLNGFFVQDAAGDGNPATSDGVFVYAPGGMDVSVGDGVRVRGSVSEYHNLTEIGASQIWGCSTGNDVPAPVVLSLPVTNVDDLEPYEGELVTFPQALVISEYFNYDRYGEIVLTSQRHLTPTAEYEPGSPEEMQAAQEYLLDKVTLDDGRSAQNPDPAIHPNGEVFNLTNLFRGGDTVANATGLLDQFDAPYRIQPVQGADYTSQNPRPAQPEDVGGSLKVVSMNVFNYFSTIDQGTGYWICGPSQDMECRGADTAEEFVRQRDKIIAAIGVMDADVIGLLEIENNINDEAVDDLVSGLNTALGAGTYEAVHTGVIGTDAIKVALIYKPASVSLVGSYAILDSSVDPRFIDTKNRPALAQTFMDNETGGIFTVAVNHLKSKGSACDDVGDPDLGDGSGNCNVTRTLAAQALVDWLATDPTGSGDRDYLIIGDLNSYDKEDPIDAIKAGADDVLGTADDYTDLVFDYGGEGAYSYVFDGQIGYLDYALASANLAAQVTGATEWHVNADEPDLIDYDMTYKLPAQDALYAPDPYRYSDHDPVIVGLNVVDLTANAGGPYTTLEGIPVQVSASDPSGSDVTFAWDLDNNGTFETPDQTVMFTSVSTPGVYTIKVMVTDTHGRFKVAETTVQVFYAYRIPVIAKN